MIIPCPLPRAIPRPAPAWATAISGPRLDPDAAAWQERVDLGDAETARLSGFLTDIRTAGMNPVQLILGRSEFKARASTTLHRSVIGEDVAISATPPDDGAEGMVFSGDANQERCRFANPIQSGDLESLSIWSVCSLPNPVARRIVVSGFGGASARGPRLMTGNPQNLTVTGNPERASAYMNYGGTDSANDYHASSIYPVFGPEEFELIGLNFNSAGLEEHIRPAECASGLTVSGASGAPPASGGIWNNNSLLGIGKDADNNNTGRMTGTVSFVMVCDHALTLIQRRVLYNALVRWQLASLPPAPLFVQTIGDSMTLGFSGGVGFYLSKSPQMFFWNESGWQYCKWRNDAEGGEGIDTQEALWNNFGKGNVTALKNFRRVVMFAPGYNSTDPVSNDPAIREALADRYIAMGDEAAALGATPLYWSSLIGAEDNSAPLNRIAFDQYLQSQATARGFLYYDHRETFDPGYTGASDFDGVDREPTYFADGRHPTLLGWQTLVADFHMRFPTPPTI